MSAYQTGVVKVTVNSPNVIGSNTEFSTYVNAGDLFRIKGESSFYQVATVYSATKLDLSSSYLNSNFSASTELNSMTYQVVTDYTTHYSFPELGSNDINFQNIYTRAMRMIDAELFDLSASTITVNNLTINSNALIPYTTAETKTTDYTITASDLGKILRMNSGSAKVFTMPSLGPEHDSGRLELHKIGAGKVTASLPSGYYIDDSSSGGTIYTESDYAILQLKYSTTGSRFYITYAKGTFTTT